MKKEFFVLRFIKGIFFTGLIHILPTLLVIAIITIGYNFLEKHVGAPINKLIINKLSKEWSFIAINYLKVPQALFLPIHLETYEDVVKKVQNSSVELHEAKRKKEAALLIFNETATPLLQKKENSNDIEYKKFIELKLEKIRESSGLKQAEIDLEREEIKLRKEIERENEIRLTKQKWGNEQPQILKEEITKKYPEVIGILISIILIFFVGVIIHSVAGRSLKNYWDKVLNSLPLVQKLYPYAKKLTEFLLETKPAQEFKSVVLIEYPRKGVYAIAFPTGEFSLDGLKGGKKTTLFIPSSPTPFTGYTIIVNEEDLIPIDITVEEAMSIIITGGVVKPTRFISSSLQNDDNSFIELENKTIS